MHLITTALEKTWPTSAQVLFLGEWCRIFSRRKAWLDLEAKVHPYHWDDRDKYYRDYLYLDSLYERRLVEISDALGAVHGVTTDVRYWRIIVGPWLRFFMDSIFDRFETIRSANESCEVIASSVLQYHLSDWTPKNFQEFYGDFTNDKWNHIVFAECMREIGMPCNVLDSYCNVSRGNSTLASRVNMRHLLKRAANFVFKFIPKKYNRVTIVSAYVPTLFLFRFQILLGQAPYISPYLNYKFTENNSRFESRALLHDKHAITQFENLLSRLVVHWMPRAYLEDFQGLEKEALRKFPQNPDVILTANAYQSDEGFKIWAAHQAMKNTPLIIEQHGGNMGIGLFNQSEDHQIKIADTFASWGWSSCASKNVLPMPSIPLASSRVLISKNNGNILMTIASYPRYFYAHYSIPVAGQVLRYVEEQIAFVKMLEPETHRALKIRLSDDLYGWDIKERFIESGEGEVIDEVGCNFLDRLNGCRISISTYNATIFLQTLAANFPTIVFFNPKYYEIRPSALRFINILRRVGILHDTPESAAKLLNQINGDILAWWTQPKLQRARAIFCSYYASSNEDWAGIWKNYLLSRELEKPLL